MEPLHPSPVHDPILGRITCISRLPVEIWETILLEIMPYRFLPRCNATLFEDMDVFSHPCKIYHYMVTIKTTLRLVCRLWNDILQRPDLGVSFIKAERTKDQITGLDYSGRRAEIIRAWRSYCRQWPCSTLYRRVGCNPFPYLSFDRRTSEEEVPIYANTLQAISLLGDARDPSQLLRSNVDLQVLSILFVGFRTAYQPGWFMRLSHLHLHSVQDDGNVYTLYLPQVVYLRLHMHLALSSKQTSYVYPLDICVPKVTTLHIEGDVFYDYVYPLTEMILGAKATIVNFLSTLPLELFPWRALDQFPRLATFGFDSSIFFLPLSNDFSLLPRPSSSSLAFIMLELENHIEGSSLHSKDSYAHNFVDMFLRPGKWVDKVVVPFVWREMEDQWVKAYDTRNKTSRGVALVSEREMGRLLHIGWRHFGTKQIALRVIHINIECRVITTCGRGMN
ncbi:hypothetical protein FRC15_000271 [Serendipita sp. 397]|nr:hypothetical protein FRC15_000271 [Serendipita sp. 397]